ncbi:hypothetical protein ABZ498_22390 [Streptomyces lavendulocolor]|uniref:hypothetical protein n=1 Tax=Streptomyces lavendulocolor TaxID=67316 RepID=UPI0033E3596B
MDRTVESIQRMAAEGAGLLAMIEALRDDDTFLLTPLRLMHALMEAFGMPLREARSLLEDLDPDLRPLPQVSDTEVDHKAEGLLSRYVTRLP